MKHETYEKAKAAYDEALNEEMIAYIKAEKLLSQTEEARKQTIQANEELKQKEAVTRNRYHIVIESMKQVNETNMA